MHYLGATCSSSNAMCFTLYYSFVRTEIDCFCNLKTGSGNGMAGLLVDLLYQPTEIVITDLQSHIDHIQHNINLNSGINMSNNLNHFVFFSNVFNGRIIAPSYHSHSHSPNLDEGFSL